MPLVGAFFASVFSGLFSFLASYFTKKLAFGTAVGVTLLAVTVAFYTAIKLLLVGVSMTISNPWLVMAFWSIMPANFATCLTAILSAEVLGFLYRHQLMTIKAVAGVN